MKDEYYFIRLTKFDSREQRKQTQKSSNHAQVEDDVNEEEEDFETETYQPEEVLEEEEKVCVFAIRQILSLHG